MSRPPRFASWLGCGQGVFYVVGGLWPLVSGGTFQAVTGDKLDFWLAQTVGLQLALAGAVLISATWRRRVTAEIGLLGGGTALLLGVIDVYCVTQPRTTRAYLLDCVVELALAVAWGAVAWHRRRAATQDEAGHAAAGLP